jgi:hypothetical protein
VPYRKTNIFLDLTGKTAQRRLVIKWLTFRSLTKRDLTITCLTIIVLLGQSGCAVKTAPPRVSEELRAGLGTIAVAPARFVPKEADFHIPTKGHARGAGRGAATGALFAAGSVELLPFIIISPVYPALIGAGALIGGAYGAGATDSKATVEEAEAAYKKTLATMNIQQALAEHILECARAQTPYTFVLWDQSPGVVNKSSDGMPLEGNEINTILEVSVLRFGLEGEKKINPPLHVSMTVNTRLIRAEDRQCLYDRTFDYASQDHKFTEWGDHDAELFRRTVGQACQELSDEIVSVLFLF